MNEWRNGVPGKEIDEVTEKLIRIRGTTTSPLILALLDIASWANAAVDLYGYASDYQDPLHQLAAALRDLEEKEEVKRA